MKDAARIEAADVRAELSIRRVFEAYGVRLHGGGRELRARICPLCGPRSREAVCVNPDRGRWHCKTCDRGGDALAALAGFCGLDVRRDFRELLATGAELAGVIPSTDPAEGARRRAELERAATQRRTAEDAARAAEQAEAVERAGSLWSRLALENELGHGYLLGRGLDPAELVRRGVVRFQADGSPVVAMHDESGGVINVVTRRREPGDGPKVLGLRGCPVGGTLIGRLSEIAAGARVVIAEGVADSLAAVLAWPSAAVLGAHGAGPYPGVARAAARRLLEVGGGRLLLAIDNDTAGSWAGTRALTAVVSEGVDPAALEIVNLGDHHDLAEAWRAGWRS